MKIMSPNKEWMQHVQDRLGNATSLEWRKFWIMHLQNWEKHKKYVFHASTFVMHLPKLVRWLDQIYKCME